ncbi:MAG: DUF1836 domain-containing protein [Tissierellia bacterium]|nr:DUF1836 domain-containing protein [Tissierellia bacterium]
MTEILKIKQVKVPRWDDLPDFGIYKDQLVTIVKEVCDPFYITDEDFITPSMVNNYVKLNRMPTPKKKKYYREHIASIIVITVLKQIISLDDISKGIELERDVYEYKQAYNMFCNVLEKSINRVFNSNEKLLFDNSKKDYETSIELITIALCMKLYTQIILKYNGIEGVKYGQDCNTN